MRYKLVTASVLAPALALVIGAADKRTQQNPQDQTINPQSDGSTWYGCGPGMTGYGMTGPGMMGYGRGMMGGYGPGMMRNWGNRPPNLNLSASDVKGYLERWIAMMGNPHLKVGPVTEKDSNTITADVVTVDKGALVERFNVDRHTGSWQPIQ